MKKIVFDFFYFTGLARIAWHHEEPSSVLKQGLDAGWLKQGQRVLEVGCGLGTNCEWLAQRGMDVTGVDLSSAAISKASKRLASKGLNAKLYPRDFLLGLEEKPFDVVLDRATLHVFPTGEKRTRFANNLASLVKPGGTLLLIEMERGKQRKNMPPFAFEHRDIEALFGSDFKVERVGEEIQNHRGLGELVFGQWRLTRGGATPS